MSLKGLIKVSSFLMVGLMAVVSATMIAYKRPTPPRQERRRAIPVTVTQLPLEDGTFPVEVRCEEAPSSAPSRLDSFSCLVINNTRKKISAFAAVYTVSLDDSAGTERESNLLISDFAIHPDVTEAKHQKLFSPGESRRVGPPGPVTFESGTVSGVELHLDYVEFEDKTSIGLNTQSSKMISAMREGAAKYKAWLVRQYKRGGNNEQAVAGLIESSELPKEFDSGDGDLREGAQFYRRLLLSIYTSKGNEELKRYLN
ncbi:MAG TPA: hypothetical protein VF654_05360, partial [Pyrinomonadaceae bacterium]